jgi:hypothetical protein
MKGRYLLHSLLVKKESAPLNSTISCWNCLWHHREHWRTCWSFWTSGHLFLSLCRPVSLSHCVLTLSHILGRRSSTVTEILHFPQSILRDVWIVLKLGHDLFLWHLIQVLPICTVCATGKQATSTLAAVHLVAVFLQCAGAPGNYGCSFVHFNWDLIAPAPRIPRYGTIYVAVSGVRSVPCWRDRFCSELRTTQVLHWVHRDRTGTRNPQLYVLYVLLHASDRKSDMQPVGPSKLQGTGSYLDRRYVFSAEVSRRIGGTFLIHLQWEKQTEKTNKQTISEGRSSTSIYFYHTTPRHIL